MKITTLVENLVYTSGLKAEHGLSMHIQTPQASILFDTGQSDMFLHNAVKLNIDIASVDYLILSHGHYDHTGGLYHFLQHNSKALVYCKRNVFNPKTHTDGRNIGTPYITELLHDRIRYVDTIIEIVPHVFLCPEIIIHNTIDTHFKGLQVQVANEVCEDSFTDELFVVVEQAHTISILTACSHRGITNICKTAIEQFSKPIQTLIGGFHTKDADELQYSFIKNYCNEYPVEKIAVCHCTGVDHYARMFCDIDSHVVYNHTGKKFNIKV